jgi:invasion protein IalB
MFAAAAISVIAAVAVTSPSPALAVAQVKTKARALAPQGQVSQAPVRVEVRSPIPSQPSTLPGAANILREAYQDWRIDCAVVDNAKHCSIGHVQTQSNGQQVLAIELQQSSENGLSGILVMPFGFNLDDGAMPKIEGSPSILPVLHFSTCLPAGCLMPITFSADDVASLRAGSALSITAIPAETSQPMTLKISLKGLEQAIDRLAQLQRTNEADFRDTRAVTWLGPTAFGWDCAKMSMVSVSSSGTGCVTDSRAR